MQCATIEYARQVSHIERADSTEFDPSTPNRVIYKLRELLGVDEMGGTMRLGAWPCKLEPGSFAHKAYGATGNFRAPSPPLRIQLRIRRHAHARRFPHHGPHAGRRVRRNCGSSRPPVVRRLPVPSRIQIQAAGAAPALRRVHSRQRRKSPPPPGHFGRIARGRRRSRHRLIFCVLGISLCPLRLCGNLHFSSHFKVENNYKPA